MNNSFLQLKRNLNALTELLNLRYIQQTLIRNAYWCWVLRETSFVCVCVCGNQRYGWVGKHGLEQNTVVLLSSVHNVSQRKAYTVPLPSIEDNEASGTEQRKLIEKKNIKKT